MVELNGNGRVALWRSIVIACIPLVPTVGVIFIYQVQSNEQQQAEIIANKVAIQQLSLAVYGMNTPLSTKVVHIEDSIGEIARNQISILTTINRENERTLQREGTLENVIDQMRTELGMTTRRSSRPIR